MDLAYPGVLKILVLLVGLEALSRPSFLLLLALQANLGILGLQDFLLLQEVQLGHQCLEDLFPLAFQQDLVVQGVQDFPVHLSFLLLQENLFFQAGQPSRVDLCVLGCLLIQEGPCWLKN